jgi:ribose transport system permease protein
MSDVSEKGAVASRIPALTALRPRLGLGFVRDYGIIVTFLALFVALSIASPAFLTTTNLLNIVNQNAAIGIIACGGTLVIIAGGFDLSVAAIYALAGVVAAEVANSVDPVLGLLVGILVGGALGLANGMLVTTARINAFIATLASGYVFRGIAILVTGGFLVSVKDETFGTIGQYYLFEVHIPSWIFLAVVLALSFVLGRTVFGRHVFAVGGNDQAARLSGVRVKAVRNATFVISGLCAGLAGVIAASQDLTGQAEAGVGFELTAIAAIVIGGTSIAGGQGAIWRSVLGVMLIALINNGFNLLNVDAFYQAVAQGLIILIAVGVDVWGHSVRVKSPASQP